MKLDGRKKACLVAKGFSQVEGLDFDQVFSPVVRFETVRLMLALATLENWYITGLDVQSAYLYGKLNEEIYMEQPKGFAVPGQERKVLCLWHALYGLKQAGLAWWRTLDESLKELGFECLKSEAGIFFYKKKDTNIVIGIIYVDDALFWALTRLLLMLSKCSSCTNGSAETLENLMSSSKCKSLAKVTLSAWISAHTYKRSLNAVACSMQSPQAPHCWLATMPPRIQSLLMQISAPVSRR